jgi:hypothetical protein
VLKTGAVDGAAMIAAVLDEHKEVSRFKTIMLVDRFNRVINEPCQDEIFYGEIA